MHRLLCALLIATLATAAHAAIYKWVDDNGVTQYTSEPPPASKKGKELKVPSGNTSNSTAGSGDAAAKKAGEEMLKNMADGVKPGTLDCAKAVSNGKDGIDTMLETGRTNVKTGHMKQSDLDKGTAQFNKVRSRISESECRSSTGAVKDFYTCLSNDYNLVMACMQKYNYM
ncbi:hypothetical protein IGB42_03989 [Andreprevotia sp. IGB-42]|uniref:DUF4124 domain-containing protein n=1 Tax=Andreprevotia sp. IGB-42 TaxID=2497473 RepID=UPI001356CEC7|nr:DUF4124 domain-containing protein [Andreprevotia sp. IGB-42]KAF0811532.1 hypothetical protein IGB42_03989 [Andreprevotia sp. IGB-42]